MAKSKAITFDKELKNALKYMRDPERLANESALATAYFLGHADARAGEPHWGHLLQRQLQQAAHSLWGDSPPRNREEVEAAWPDILAAPDSDRYSYLVLELRYFQEFFHPRSLQQIWEEFLQQSRAEFYRDIDRAVETLADALLTLLRPGARLEPLPSVQALVGRTELLQRIEEALLAGDSAAVSGVSGAGKSSLAARVAARWETPAVFWYTVRSDLTDRLYSLLYALGAFFHQHGADALWRALAAGAGRLDDVAVLYALAQRDLADLADARPLLIFDEADLWTADAPETVRIAEFLGALQSRVSMLFVGQQVNVAAGRHFMVDILPPGAAYELFAVNGIELSLEEGERLYQETGGNPRLLWLCINLLKAGETLGSILSVNADRAGAFEAYLALLWRRLDENERHVLHALAVYPAEAPRDIWPAHILDGLHARHLVRYDRAGGMTLLPGVRAAFLRTLSAEQREEFHRQAAVRYAERAETTLAAYHFHHGARPDLAVALWFPQRQREIARGQAATAASVFHNISCERLKKKEQQALKLIRAELHQLVGQATAGLTALADLREEAEENELLAAARQLEGDFLDALGSPDDALSAYTDGLAMLARLEQHAAEFYVRRGMVHVRQRRLAEAWRSAQEARFQAEYLQGLVYEQQGELTAAEIAYHTALEIASTLDFEQGLAKTHRSLCNIYGRRGEAGRAYQHAADAMTLYERMGDLVNVALVQSNLAATYLDVGEFTEVLAVGGVAFEFFQQHGYSHRLAGTACNLAEAHYELGELDKARAMADLALRQEEPLAAPYALYTLALVARARGETDMCLTLLADCRREAQANEDIFVEAYAWSKTAEVLAESDAASESGDERLAAAEQARKLFQRLGMEDMAATVA
ncbi:MAG: ATP-binding protein [Caldilineaceae bacterium]|nr:ATP-binding protein [Caldilineaceae bacterium]